MDPAPLRILIRSILGIDAAVVVAAILYWRWPRAPAGSRLRRLTAALIVVALCLGASWVGLRRLKRREQALSHYYAGIDQKQRGDLAAAEREFRESLRWDPRAQAPRRELERAAARPRAAKREQSVQLEPVPGGGAGPPSANPKTVPSPAAPPAGKPEHPPHLPSPFAIKRYALDVQLDPARHQLAATADIALVTRKERLTKLNFSLSPEFTVDAITQGTASLRYEQRNDLIEVQLSQALDRAHEQTLRIRYRRRSPSGSGEGLPSVLAGGDRIDPSGTYLRSEARWYPATGELDFRAPVAITVTVPRGYAVVSVGGLQSITKRGDEATFRWATRRPAAMISLAAARYVQQSQVVDGVKIATYLFAKDAARAPAYLRETARILRYFSRRFGPYPFEKLAVVEIPAFPGGYGTTSFVMLTEASFRGKTVPVDFLAHEIAHQWWGNSVFPQGPGAGWLSEAFAEYAAMLYQERVGGRPALRSAVRQATEEYFAAVAKKPEESIQETDPYDQRGAYQAVIYQKGALVLHALRYTLGDAAFFRLLRRFADRHAYGLAHITDFRAEAERVHGAPLGWFFDQWLGRTGVPRLTYRYVTEGESVVVEVTQPEPPYRLPIDMVVDSQNRIKRHRVMLEGTRRQLTVPIEAPVSALGFDPDEWILKAPVRWERASE